MATLKELLDQLRLDLDEQNYGDERDLWTENELVSYINRAENEACLRARLLRDTESDLCSIYLRPGTNQYHLDSRILEVRRVMVDGHRLFQTNADTLDRDCPGWTTRQSERPEYYITDLDACSMRVFPEPSLVKTLQMTVTRLPLRAMSLDDPEDCPEIPLAYHYDLLDYAAYLALRKHDRDGFSPEEAMSKEQRFAQQFGRRRSAEEYNLVRENRNDRVRARFI